MHGGGTLTSRREGADPAAGHLAIGACAGRLLGQPLTFAMLSAAQLGVPVAAATIGIEEHLRAAGESAALMFGALLTIAATSIAGALAARGQTAADPDEPADADKHA
jgi:hypothetical protein